MMNVAAEAPIAFLSAPHITSDAYNAGALVANDTLLNSLVYRLYQLDPSQVAASAAVPSVGVPIVVTAGIYVGSALTIRSGDVFFLLNTNIKNFLLEYCNDYGTGNTWTTAVDYSSTDLAAPDLIKPLAAPIQYNGLRLTVYATQDGLPISLSVFNAALLLYQTSRGFTDYGPVYRQTSREVVLADGTTDTAYIYWSDGSFTLQDISLGFDLMTATDKSGIESVINSQDSFLVFIEPYDVPRGLFLCKVKTGTYNPKYSTQYKGSGYKFKLDLKQMGWL